MTATAEEFAVRKAKQASRLRIAVIVDPEIPVPPRHYGGIERVVDLLIRGLVSRGHRVTLFAHPASQVACQLVALPGSTSRGRLDTLNNSLCVVTQLLGGGYDLAHSFARLAYLLPLLPLNLPKLMTYQRQVTPSRARWAQAIAGRSLHFTGCSHRLIRRYSGRPNWHVVHNGVPIGRFAFQEHVPHDAPLVFLGRLEEIKGPHLAIEVARRSQRRLVIAGNVPESRQGRAYFEQRIKPWLDGDRVRYLGPVADDEKAALLGQAAALLMPILWDEPFGIVMAEALACGTPVVALRRGSVPEVIEHGVTGWICEDVEALIAAVPRVGELSRSACRSEAEQRFSESAVVEGYLRLYRALAGSSAGRRWG